MNKTSQLVFISEMKLKNPAISFLLFNYYCWKLWSSLCNV